MRFRNRNYALPNKAKKEAPARLFVHVDFSNSAAKELKIKSVQFSTEENFTEGPGVETPEATKALY